MANTFIPTKKNVVIGGAIVGALILALGANFVILPAVNSISEVNTAIEEASFARDDAELLLVNAKNDQKDYDAVKSLDQSLIGQFPDTGETQLLIETIQQGALDSGIPLTNLTSIGFTAVTLKTPTVSEAAPEAPADDAGADPAAGTEGNGAPVSEETATEVSTPTADTTVAAGYGELELSLNIKGSPTQIQSFLNFLNNLERAVIIQGTSITPEGEDGSTVALSFSAKTYVYAQIPDPTTVSTTPNEETTTEENAG